MSLPRATTEKINDCPLHNRRCMRCILVCSICSIQFAEKGEESAKLRIVFEYSLLSLHRRHRSKNCMCNQWLGSRVITTTCSCSSLKYKMLISVLTIHSPAKRSRCLMLLWAWLGLELKRFLIPEGSHSERDMMTLRLCCAA